MTRMLPLRTSVRILLLAGVLLVAAGVACSTEVKDVTGTPAPRGDAPPPAAPAEPTAVPTPVLKLVGIPSIFEGRTGRFSITVNKVTDPSRSTNQFNAAQGRWVLVDWTVTNEGTANLQLSTLDLKLLTRDNFEIGRGNHAGHPEPQIDAFPTLGPGQSIRGFYAYDVPTGALLTGAIYHPTGSPQLLVANLP